MRLTGYAIAALYAVGLIGLMVIPLVDPDEMVGVVWGGVAAIGAVLLHMHRSSRAANGDELRLPFDAR